MLPFFEPPIGNNGDFRPSGAKYERDTVFPGYLDCRGSGRRKRNDRRYAHADSLGNYIRRYSARAKQPLIPKRKSAQQAIAYDLIDGVVPADVIRY